MNSKQRVTRNAALVVFLLAALFPPWSYVLQGWSTQCFAGYRFVFAPPALKSPDEFRLMFFVYDSPGGSDVVVRLEYIRLLVECLALLFFSVGLNQILADGASHLALTAGGIGILIGIALIALWLWIPVCHAR
ncbi:MAG TPA: hypothetical protein VLM38_04055 [Blastocatellia bacterium]|nr:hypothetical protein [Blastocatellia bacterium]